MQPIGRQVYQLSAVVLWLQEFLSTASVWMPKFRFLFARSESRKIPAGIVHVSCLEILHLLSPALKNCSRSASVIALAVAACV